MPRSSPQAPLQRHDLDVVKQQLVVLVSVVTTVIVLCPEWLQFYRNLCAIPLLAWLTSRGFDFVIKLDKAWDSAPAMVKYFVPVDFPTITPPYEQIRGLTKRRMEITTIKLRRFASEMRRILLALVNWILCQMPRDTFTSDSPGSQQDKPAPKPKPDGWVAILVATPLIFNDISFSFGPDTIREICDEILWESTEVSTIPPICPSTNLQVELTLCLIPKSIWHSSKTVLEKFMTGLYWHHQPGNVASRGDQWDETRIRNISRAQVIGHIKDHNKIDQVNEEFDSLRLEWNDTNKYWNNIDFAIILAFLFVGISSTEICKKIFDQFASLRMEEAQRNYDLNRSRFGAGAAVLTLLTGGLAAPLTIPMMMGASAAEVTMSSRDRYLWDQRMSRCKDISERYESLTALVEVEEIKVFTPKAPIMAPAMESSWFVDDAW
ncbi:Ff.00g134730.m01.CDS01 [Fusarium sp. VM40]|nr:Ff.00g134730.m01.CDS01 [Fusarium sp. VM40]